VLLTQHCSWTHVATRVLKLYSSTTQFAPAACFASPPSLTGDSVPPVSPAIAGTAGPAASTHATVAASVPGHAVGTGSGSHATPYRSLVKSHSSSHVARLRHTVSSSGAPFMLPLLQPVPAWADDNGVSHIVSSGPFSASPSPVDPGPTIVFHGTTARATSPPSPNGVPDGGFTRALLLAEQSRVAVSRRPHRVHSAGVVRV
jgi:hypothetical protein